ncbi:MAG TPA: hypothetical protein VED01_06780 [Burkholderiales bacterium]|nr:hypothetical protein [Burkholderiales bacterium]
MALDAALAAQPPLTWDDIPFVFFGMFLGSIFVVGIQLARAEPKHSRWALRFFIPGAAWWTTSGIGALVLTLRDAGVTPVSLLFISAGSGMLLGLWVCWQLFRRKFAVAP